MMFEKCEPSINLIRRRFFWGGAETVTDGAEAKVRQRLARVVVLAIHSSLVVEESALPRSSLP